MFFSILQCFAMQSDDEYEKGEYATVLNVQEAHCKENKLVIILTLNFDTKSSM